MCTKVEFGPSTPIFAWYTIATATYRLLAQPAFATILERQSNVRHTCEAETSMLLALEPGLVDMVLAQNAVGPTAREVVDIVGSTAAHRWQSFKSRTEHGAIGDPRAASAEKGEPSLGSAAATPAPPSAWDPYQMEFRLKLRSLWL